MLNNAEESFHDCSRKCCHCYTDAPDTTCMVSLHGRIADMLPVDLSLKHDGDMLS